MANEIDYTRKCQQLDVLIDLLERENKRLREMIVRCGECVDWDKDQKHRDDADFCYCPILDGFMKADDFCSYGARRATT